MTRPIRHTALGNRSGKPEPRPDSNITLSVASVTPTSPLPTLEVPVTHGAVTINNFGLTLNGGNSTVQNVTIKNANDTGLLPDGDQQRVTRRPDL